MSTPSSHVRPKPDKVSASIVDDVLKYKIDSKLVLDTARNCLIDTLDCGLEALICSKPNHSYPII